MADYLAAYARRFDLPVRNGVKVDGLSRTGTRYVVSAGDTRFDADHVVIAMSNYQEPVTPPFAHELDPVILQLHASDYRNPAQLRDGAALVVGAGNSGAEIAIELIRSRKTWLAGREVSELPFNINSFWGRRLQFFVVGFVFHRLLTTDTSMGRKARASHTQAPLIRTKSADLAAAGVARVPKVVGVRNGKPLLEDGRVLDVANVIWCSGYRPDHAWIHLPVFDAKDEPVHERGVVKGEPGLYFVGPHFLYAMSSSMVRGVGRDAHHVVDAIAARCSVEQSGVGYRNGPS
jgi:putative flavoprotein involved in K+ transport